MTAKLHIDVWSDIACPWCYVGKRRLETALAKFAHTADVDVVWRSFELDPSAPPSAAAADPGAYADRLARKYRLARHQAEQMIAQMTRTAAADGIEMRFDRIRAGNTFDAHRVLHFAAERGVQDAAKERLLRAYFSDGEPISDHAALARLAAEVGLDDAEVRAMLASDRFASEVRADETLARELGISGVPCFVLGGQFAISGAQPPETLVSVLDQAWTKLVEAPGAAAASVDDGASCGPAGCD